MKQLLLPLIIGLTITRIPAQTPPLSLPLDPDTHKVAYSVVTPVDGTQAQLYGRAKAWAAGVIIAKGGKLVTEDEGTGLLIYNLGLPFTSGKGMTAFEQTLWQVVRIDVKDGKARIQVSGFETQPYINKANAQTQPSAAQIKHTPIESYLDKSNKLYYTGTGEVRPYTLGIFNSVQHSSMTLTEQFSKAISSSYTKEW